MGLTLGDMPRRRNLRNYSVHELSLVLEPDIGRRAAILKSRSHDPDAKRIAAVDEVIARINKSRIGNIDQMGNPIDDPNALTPAAQRTIQALARQMALHRDELTLQDIMDVASKVGLAPGNDTAQPNDPAQPANSQSPASSSGLVAQNDDVDDEDDFPDQEDDDDDVSDDEGDDFLDDDDESADDDTNPGDAPEDDDDYNEQLPGDDAVESAAQPSADGNGAPQQPVEKPSHSAMKWDTPPPDNVDPQDHAQALGGAKDAYLSHLSKKGYNFKAKGNAAPPTNANAKPPHKKQPDDGKGKRAMPNDLSQMVNKSTHGVDWSKFNPDQREQLEPVLKSMRASSRESERLATENKELIEKHRELGEEVRKMRADAERRELVQKTAALTHLTGHDVLVDTAMALPSGEQRDKFVEALSAQNAQIEEIKKSRGDITAEAGTRNGGEPIINSGEDATDAWSRMLAERITKSAEKGEVLDEARAAQLILKTKEGKQAYNRYNDALMRRN